MVIGVQETHWTESVLPAWLWKMAACSTAQQPMEQKEYL